jgi:hypothetical protein
MRVGSLDAPALWLPAGGGSNAAVRHPVSGVIRPDGLGLLSTSVFVRQRGVCSTPSVVPPHLWSPINPPALTFGITARLSIDARSDG